MNQPATDQRSRAPVSEADAGLLHSVSRAGASPNSGKIPLSAQEQWIDEILICLFQPRSRALEGVPGLAKTLSISTPRGQKTLDFPSAHPGSPPDLNAADVTGRNSSRGPSQPEHRETADSCRTGCSRISFGRRDQNRNTAQDPGLVLRSDAGTPGSPPPRTNTVLDEFRFRLATQKPIEQEGTYRCREAATGTVQCFKDFRRLPEFRREFDLARRTTERTSEVLL